MFTKLQIIHNDKIVDCILLAKFSMVENSFLELTKKILCFKSRKQVPISKIVDCCLVFIPWKSKMKELILINQEAVVSQIIRFEDNANIIEAKEFDSNYTLYYYENKPIENKLHITNYTGYEFIKLNQLFIASIKFEDKDACYDILYKNLPELLYEEVAENILLDDALFKLYTDNIGTDNLEFQYANEKNTKNIVKNTKKLLKNMEFNKNNSLFVLSSSFSMFLKNFKDIFHGPISPDGSGTFCLHGINYYDKQKTKDIFNKIKVINYNGKERLLIWLYKAYTEHNGFYILGL